jgi:hypothetical protein
MGKSNMILKDNIPTVSGQVSVKRVGREDVMDQSHIITKSNVITYKAADIMARMLGGDITYIPSHIGYLYGPTAAGSPMPNPESTRDHTMDQIATELLALGGNMLISPVSKNPEFTSDDDTLYDGNVVTTSAISDSTGPLVFSSSLGYAALPPQDGTDTYYQVLLLTRIFAPGSTTPTYIPFARTQLAAGITGIAVQPNSELAVFWQLTFS